MTEIDVSIRSGVRIPSRGKCSKQLLRGQIINFYLKIFLDTTAVDMHRNGGCEAEPNTVNEERTETHWFNG